MGQQFRGNASEQGEKAHKLIQWMERHWSHHLSQGLAHGESPPGTSSQSLRAGGRQLHPRMLPESDSGQVLLEGLEKSRISKAFETLE